MAEGHRLLINDAIRFDGVSVTGVTEHVSRDARRGGKYFAVIIDLTPISQRTGPARLSDLGEGRSKQFLDSDCFESRESIHRSSLYLILTGLHVYEEPFRRHGQCNMFILYPVPASRRAVVMSSKLD